MSMNISRLSNLNRYNNMPRIKNESLAEHMYYVAIIARKLMDKMIMTPEEKLDTLSYVLCHDTAELYTGDVPHNVKQDHPEFKEFIEKIEDQFLLASNMKDLAQGYVNNPSEVKYLAFKLSDILQVLMYAEDELQYGNSHIEFIEIVNTARNISTQLVNQIFDKGYSESLIDYQQLLNDIRQVIPESYQFSPVSVKNTESK